MIARSLSLPAQSLPQLPHYPVQCLSRGCSRCGYGNRQKQSRARAALPPPQSTITAHWGEAAAPMSKARGNGSFTGRTTASALVPPFARRIIRRGMHNGLNPHGDKRVGTPSMEPKKRNWLPEGWCQLSLMRGGVKGRAWPAKANMPSLDANLKTCRSHAAHLADEFLIGAAFRLWDSQPCQRWGVEWWVFGDMMARKVFPRR